MLGIRVVSLADRSTRVSLVRQCERCTRESAARARREDAGGPVRATFAARLGREQRGTTGHRPPGLRESPGGISKRKFQTNIRRMHQSTGMYPVKRTSAILSVCCFFDKITDDPSPSEYRDTIEESSGEIPTRCERAGWGRWRREQLTYQGTVNNEQQTIQINTGKYLQPYRSRRRPLGSLLHTTRGNRFEITALSQSLFLLLVTRLISQARRAERQRLPSPRANMIWASAWKSARERTPVG